MDDFPLPQQAAEEESKAIFQNRIQQSSRQGLKAEDIEKNRDEWWKESQTQGQARVKLTLVLSKIAEEEKVTVEKEDLAQAATREAMMRREDPTKFIKELTQDRNRLNRLREDIVYDKTLIKIAELSKEQICDIEGDHTTDESWVHLPLPYVYEREGRQERAWDIYSRLLRDRIVFIGTPIDDYVANSIIAQLLFLQMEDPKKDVHLYINSPGGAFPTAWQFTIH